MNKIEKAFVDVDDLWCEKQIEEFLLPIKEVVPHFQLTCYTIPNRFGPVGWARDKYPWITFGIHGWEHTMAECAGWTAGQARSHINAALGMGYAAVFKPPNWICDEELEVACKDLNVLLHLHPSAEPKTKGLKFYTSPRTHPVTHVNIHTHIQKNPVTDWIGTVPSFRPDYLAMFKEFLTPSNLDTTR